MTLLVVLLAKIDNRPLESWSLPIQPNSLIAVLTTVAKAAMMVPAASCISQLKWRHFTMRARRLVDLQLFDDASRGPWGSVIIIWSLPFRARALLASGFAFVTIVALGIDASAQQVIEFTLQSSPLSNASVELGMADMYLSKGFLDDTVYESSIWKPNPDLLAIQSPIINGATGSVFPPHFKCPEPATRCSWETMTTLGVCIDFKNVTDLATPKCAPMDNAGTLNCIYEFPGKSVSIDPDDDLTMSWNQESLGGAGPTTMLFQSQVLNYVQSNYNPFGYFQAVKASTDGYPIARDDGEDYEPPPVEVYYSTFAWCMQTFHNVTASQSAVTAESMTSETLSFAESHFVGEEGNPMGQDYYTFVANSSAATFNVSLMATGLLAMGFALQNSNLSTVISNIAGTITNQIRSRDPGDIQNASSMAGNALFNEPYIHVRWPWMILPLAETLLTTFLLVTSIIITHRQPLLKQSLMALLSNRLEGWDDEELEVPGAQTQEKLDALAESMLAQLEANDTGRLRLTRKKLE
ncbi:Uu.00g025430.m01.CDS01 [Anthostomella pinea]|uniref:Uu.00g025430.m01.CDS01 n=1 Tax=Anthostomella pinea TaxID=933095 RepID=A0AAI8V8C6_9PEZI|nr:Uu.00g025430.m01.CDS01 [Anthostomella pinea]